MRKIFYILALGFMFTSCSGNRIVDYASLESLISIHKKQQPQYKTVKNNEGGNLVLQKLVTKHTKENTAIREKIRKRITNTQLLLADLGKLPDALRTINDIKNYQVELVELVSDNPELSLIAIKTEIAMIKRVNRLYKYVYLNALIGSDFNVMPIAKRLEIIDYVVKELRVIRGFCYSILRKMKSAKYGNLINKLLREFDIGYIYRDIDKYRIINQVKPRR